MPFPWLLFLVFIAAGQEVHEIAEESPINTTTLYPITHKIINRNYSDHSETQQEYIINDITKENNAKENKAAKDIVEVPTLKKEKISSWVVDTNYGQGKDKQSQAIYAQPENKESQGIQAKVTDKGNQSVYVQPNDKKIKDSNITDSKEQISVEAPCDSKEKIFKPSPHLGSFFDDENLNLLKFSTSEPSVFTGMKPAVDFLGSKDFYMLNYKNPKDIYRNQQIAPYSFESADFLTTHKWKQTLESKPTVESSVTIPAGGLYKHSDPFNDKPRPGADDDDLRIAFNGYGKEKESPVKKRSNPWKNLVQLVTAFLPVGLIISALTPSIITLHSTDNDPYLSRVTRRADGDFAGVPAISERCRRRLLCEIHSEENYIRSQDPSRYVRKHCYKLLCEEPQALRRVLGWLLAHRPRPPHAPLPAAHAQITRDHYTDVTDHHHRSNDYT